MESVREQPWLPLAAIATAVSITLYWVFRPTWRMISENPYYDISGFESRLAIVATVLHLAVLGALWVVSRRPRSQARKLGVVLLCAAIPLAAFVPVLAALLGLFPDRFPAPMLVE